MPRDAEFVHTTICFVLFDQGLAMAGTIGAEPTFTTVGEPAYCKKAWAALHPDAVTTAEPDDGSAWMGAGSEVRVFEHDTYTVLLAADPKQLPRGARSRTTTQAARIRPVVRLLSRPHRPPSPSG